MDRPVYLVVVRGLDAGVKLLVDGTPKTVGRSRGADLVLSDPSVSRHHFQIVAVEHGARVSSCPGATPLVVRERAVEGTELSVGEPVIAGSTVLMLAEGGEGHDPGPPASRRGGTLQTLMSGVATDVRGLAAVFALNDALSEVQHGERLIEALASWAKTYAECEAVELLDADRDDGEIAPHAGDLTALTEVVVDGRTRMTVSAYGTRAGRIAFVIALPPDRVSDLLRRLLVVAGALFGSSFVRLKAVSEAQQERDSMRRLAIGSSRVFSGTSSAAEEVARILPRIASSSATVLLLGETGVGKSFVARLIHESGPRARDPLRIINCAAVPGNLVESELFGHERGAFSGAVSAREGVLEAAGRGTVLLDEIGEMPLASQAKLLRVLEERRFERVGSNRSLALQARVIAATNRDLAEMVEAGEFRQDLFFRISVVTVRVPALRERANDLQLLARQILADLAPTSGRRVDGFSREALDLVRRYSWPGNVRELRNAIEHALVLGEGRLIHPGDFPASVRMASPEQPSDPSVVWLPAPLDWLEHRAIEAALRATDGNRTRAAALLGIKPAVLYYKLRQTPPPE